MWAGGLEFWPETSLRFWPSLHLSAFHASRRYGSGKDQFFALPPHVFAFRAEHHYPPKKFSAPLHGTSHIFIHIISESFVWPTRFLPNSLFRSQLGDFKSFPRLWGEVWTTLQWMSARESFTFGRFVKAYDILNCEVWTWWKRHWLLLFGSAIYQRYSLVNPQNQLHNH